MNGTLTLCSFYIILVHVFSSKCALQVYPNFDSFCTISIILQGSCPAAKKGLLQKRPPCLTSIESGFMNEIGVTPTTESQPPSPQPDPTAGRGRWSTGALITHWSHCTDHWYNSPGCLKAALWLVKASTSSKVRAWMAATLGKDRQWGHFDLKDVILWGCLK